MSGWFLRRPQWGLVASLTLVATGLAALLSSVVAVLIAAHRVSHSSGQAHATESVALGLSVVVAAAIVLAVVGGGLMSLLTRAVPELWRDRALRRAMSAALAPRPAAGDSRGPAVVLLDEEWPVAMGVPGRRGVVLVTAGLSRCLSPEQLAAVVAHEQAHLRWRHASVSRWTALLTSSFPGSVRAHRFRRWLDLLLELVADDAAARRVGVRPTAQALGILGRLRDDDQLVRRARRLAVEPD